MTDRPEKPDALTEYLRLQGESSRARKAWRDARRAHTPGRLEEIKGEIEELEAKRDGDLLTQAEYEDELEELREERSEAISQRYAPEKAAEVYKQAKAAAAEQFPAAQEALREQALPVAEELAEHLEKAQELADKLNALRANRGPRPSWVSFTPGISGPGQVTNWLAELDGDRQ